ncbi:tetratricopeptide repeat protein [Thermococcus sp. AM4]|uniref:tetratricopeptide repeat protein n=1 Tax=Thermococcus sp. (strain AM4) TaxID=246969 RepID=UPI0002299771|nr:tetratricopeptide repeat protein [Thermococcus sp. AM4]EEB73925.2 tetratricopeptide repeat domain protein [Thermococcus sp. AM4]
MDTVKMLRIISNETNLQILSVLKSGSFNPRELARILQRDETDVSRRLRLMERLGLVEGRWVRVRGRNVRVYSLKVGELRISFEPGGVVLQTSNRVRYEVPLLEERLPRVGLFVGRSLEVSRLVSAEESVIVIYGMAGIGKTSLAARVFGDAFWYQMTGVEGFDYLAWQLGLFLNTRGYSLLLDYLRGGGREERAIFELILEGIEETGAKIVLDDLHKCRDDVILRLVSFLSSRLRNGKLVLLSRERPNLGLWDNLLYLHLRGLEPEDAYELLRSRGVEMEPDEFAKLYGVTRGHPLALNLYAEAGGGTRGDIGNFFDAIFAEAYGSLTEDEREMLSLMALFEEPLEYDAIKRLYGRRNTFPVLYSLLRKGLVERSGESYFLHDLVRSLARKGFHGDERDYYLEYAEYLLSKNSPTDFIRAFRYTIRSGRFERFRDLTETRIRRFNHLIADFPTAYLRVLSEAEESPYVDSEIAEVYFQRGFFDRAEELWLKALDGLDGIHLANVLSYLSDLYIERNEFEKAREYLKRTEAIAETLNDPLVWLWYHMERTKYDYYTGDLEGALRSAVREMEVLKLLPPDPEREVKVLFHVGDVYCEMGECGKGVDYYLRALEFSLASGLTFSASMARFELSKAYYNLGDYGKAAELAGEASEYFLRIKNYRRAVDSLAYMTVALIGLGELEEAERNAEKMIALAQSTNYPLAWAGYLFLGAVRELMGDDGGEYFRRGREHLGKYEWLYDAVLHELGRVFDLRVIHNDY